jgi:NAD(P)-dependent dehydrogenase (short-subunit alcohol dehydrogenase family)
MSLPDIAAILDLSGKIAIITGAGEGIGAEIAGHFAAAHATVVIADRNLAGAQDLAARITEAGGRAKAIAFDAGDEQSIVKLFDATIEEFGRLDILVNNAGIQNRAYLQDTTAELWDSIQRINARGPFLCIREAARRMREAGNGGRIVNISSIGSIHPVMHGLTAYNSSKAAVNALTRNAAFELASDGITVNAIFPGGIATQGAARTAGSPVSGRAITPPILKRGVETRDIAIMALFLAGPQADIITGQTFTVDAGFLLG